MEEKELAYLAGFFDADGTVGVYADGHNLHLRVRVSGIDEASIRRYQNAFGGCISMSKWKGQFARRCIWEWTARGASAIPVLEALLPYVSVKKEQVIEALRYPVLPSHIKNPEASSLKRLIAERLKAMKREMGIPVALAVRPSPVERLSSSPLVKS